MASILHFFKQDKISGSASRKRTISEFTFGLVAILLDIVVIFSLSVATGYFYHFVSYDNSANQIENYLKLAGLVSLIYIVLNFIHNRYKISAFLSAVPNIKVVFKIWNHTFLFVLTAIFLEKSTDDFSRGSVILFYFAGFVSVWAVRKLFKFLAVWGCQEGHISARRIMLVGSGERLERFKTVYQPGRSGLKLVDSLVLDYDIKKFETLSQSERKEQEKELENAVIRARNLEIDEIYLLVPWSAETLIKRYAEAFRRAPVSIQLGQETLLNSFDDVEIATHGNISSMNLVRPPLSRFEVAMKRAFDIVVSFTGIIVLLLFFPLLAYWIKREDRGAIFFKQPRGGFNKHPFCIYKLRTFKEEQSGVLVANADGKETVAQTVVGDDRVTEIGHFLRKWNIDELPQLLNVLKGDMSIVGPRPHAVEHDEEFSDRVGTYARRHNVKPGITGWAQVTGFRGITDTDEKIKGRVKSDLYYIDHWSIWFDIYIVFLTVFSKKARENAV